MASPGLGSRRGTPLHLREDQLNPESDQRRVDNLLRSPSHKKRKEGHDTSRNKETSSLPDVPEVFVNYGAIKSMGEALTDALDPTKDRRMFLHEKQALALWKKDVNWAYGPEKDGKFFKKDKVSYRKVTRMELVLTALIVMYEGQKEVQETEEAQLKLYEHLVEMMKTIIDDSFQYEPSAIADALVWGRELLKRGEAPTLLACYKTACRQKLNALAVRKPDKEKVKVVIREKPGKGRNGRGDGRAPPIGKCRDFNFKGNNGCRTSKSGWKGKCRWLHLCYRCGQNHPMVACRAFWTSLEGKRETFLAQGN